MKPKQTTSKIRIEQLDCSRQIEKISDAEAVQINGGNRREMINAYPFKYVGSEFKSGDETMAQETIDIVYEDFQKYF